MSGKRPFFITGANAKIKINGRTMAFCTDISYSIQVMTQTPKILGMYEGSSVEPLGYSVSGSFTIIRYAKDAKDQIGGTAPDHIAANDAGNGVGNWGGVWGGGSGDFFARNGVGNDGRANESLDPSRFANGTTFDIEIYQKTRTKALDPKAGLSGIATAVTDGAKNLIDVLAGGTGPGDVSDVLGVAKIRNCRITKADFSLNKKGAATQRFDFAALYVDEDAFVADFSGLGQHNQG